MTGADPRGGGVRGDKAPLSYTSGSWPYEAVPYDHAPIGVHYSLALARRLASLAAARGLSHRALSERAGLHSAAVGRIVRGEVYPDLSTLARLEQALETDIYPSGLYRR